MDVSSPCHAVGAVLVDELASNLGKFVGIEDIHDECPSDEDDNSDEGYEELEPCGLGSAKKSSCSAPLDEEDNEPKTAFHQMFSEEPPSSVSVPLVSALKGSREKQGESPRKLSVTWAPDVYDPIPNSVSHAVKSKQKKSRKDRDREKDNSYNKKNGKKGQKGSFSRGSGGKDKKKFGKHGGRPDKSYRTMDAPNDLDGFNVGSPDYCGSSFLKTSAAKCHYSVAEV